MKPPSHWSKCISPNTHVGSCCLGVAWHVLQGFTPWRGLLPLPCNSYSCQCILRGQPSIQWAHWFPLWQCVALPCTFGSAWFWCEAPMCLAYMLFWWGRWILHLGCTATKGTMVPWVWWRHMSNREQGRVQWCRLLLLCPFPPPSQLPLSPAIRWTGGPQGSHCW